jgi:hypothetical protein
LGGFSRGLFLGRAKTLLTPYPLIAARPAQLIGS